MSESLTHMSGFHKKTIQERQEIIRALFPQVNGSISDGGLDLKTADLMIENCIGRLSLPLGLGLYFQVNNKNYIVPMCTEEPSIVAAATSAAKLIKQHGGFKSSSTAPIMTGQIQLLDIEPTDAKTIIESHKEKLIKKANQEYCPRMVIRGGGVIDIAFIQLSAVMGIVEISVNVCDAMGANIVNSLCENLAKDVLALIPNCRTGLRILSNYCTQRRVITEFRIPIEDMAYKSLPGLDVSKRMIEALEFARLSVYRACTHNKGILNGIDAVGLATGQDTRGIEAAAHAWCCRNGNYQPLTEFWTEGNFFYGRLEIPIAVGTQGGALKSNSLYQTTQYILGFPSALELAQVMASVGLACNFSSLRAMVTEGIQRGHMGLHAKNIAIAAGVPSELVDEVVEYMKQRKSITHQTALEYLAAHQLHTLAKKQKGQQNALNTFYVDIPDGIPPFKLSIAFDCPTLHGIHIVIDNKAKPFSTELIMDIHEKLFGRHKYEWIINFLAMLEFVRFEPKLPRANAELRNKMKFLCIWLDLISISLLNCWDIHKVGQVFLAITQRDDLSLGRLVKGADSYIEFAVYLVRELWNIFNYHIDGWISQTVQNSNVLAEEIRREAKTVLFSNIRAKQDGDLSFDDFFEYRKKQMCATLMFLCDLLGETKIDVELIRKITEVGDILETMSTSIRDLNKVKKNDMTKPNSYLYWLKFFKEEEKTGEDKYIMYIQQKIDFRQEHMSKSQQKILKVARKFLSAYYNPIPKL
ncbi:unnamed protein product [Blepharisma stoltei]|uniref:3-hydroxy-3-methylglutaryl coenzyme A reductase n=1 Tax=Blepharisma stoltei TaxID=1481888 RepID=A0AAU9JU90_9CILI|nr:unnamed protein product [Blepharisma stoltei]